MINITLKSIWDQRRRLASTCVAVVIGVAFLTGTMVLGDTLSANFERLFTDVSANTDVVVRNATVVDEAADADEARGPIDQSLVDDVRSVDGVAAAEAQVVGFGTLVGRDGDGIGGNGPPRLAGSWINDPDLNPYQLAEGRAPEAPGEVIINRGAAEAGDLDIGDTTTLQTIEPVEVSIVGLATFGGTDGLGDTTWTAFTLEGAQQAVTGQPGQVSTVFAKAEPGISADTLRDRVTDALPNGVEAITGSELTDERTDSIARTFLDSLRTFLVAFAGIALVVTALTINNTFTITIAQRTRELALLRAVGATRRQLRRTVTLEALMIGAASSVVGLVAGLGVAGGLKGVFEAFGGALPAGGLTINPIPLVIAFVVGVVVTLVAAQLPARRAAAIPPIAALRGLDEDHRQVSRSRRVTATVLLGAGIAGAVGSAIAGALLGSGLAALLVIAGTLAVAPLAVPAAARAIGLVLRRVRQTTGGMAEQNARRTPRRTAATATALVVGVAVVTMVTVFAGSTKTSLTDDVTNGFQADLAVNTPVFGGGRLSPRTGADVRALPEVDQAVSVGGGALLLDGETTIVTATDVAQIDDVLTVDTTAGALTDVGDDGIAVSEGHADNNDWTVGSRIEATFADGSVETVTVRTIYDATNLTGSVLMPEPTWARHTSQPTGRTVFINTTPGVSADQARQAILPIAERYGGDVQNREELAGANTEGIDMLLGIIYVLLALAIIIALLGIANTLSLAVYERRREIGLLRAVGQTRRQVRSVLRLESIIVSTFGTVLGLVLGGFLGWTMFTTINDGGGFTLPVGQLAVVAVLGAAAGALAARRPARRAARIPILDAIAGR